LCKILEGEKKDLRLFARNPFPNAPPNSSAPIGIGLALTKPGERGWLDAF